MSKNSNAESIPAIDRTFLNILANHKGGACVSDVSAALKQVTAAAQETGRAGKVILTMSLRPASKGTAGTLVFETKVKAQVPEAEAAGSIFYADADYNLVREDPNQRKLDLRVVAPKQEQHGELRKAD